MASSIHGFVHPLKALECKKELYYTDDWDGKHFAFTVSPPQKNAENDCSDYKRKWWKFWVK